jgi:ATP-binding cassette, subfamily B, bacterial CvaB/MchF/RaxB
MNPLVCTVDAAARPGRNLPLIRQAQAAECALACVAMIAAYHGCRISLAALRDRAVPSSRGLSLAQIVKIAAELNLRARAFRLEHEEVMKLKVPCILHWNSHHYVVLRWADDRHFLIHDPLTGVREISVGKAVRHFTGFALELWPQVSEP